MVTVRRDIASHFDDASLEVWLASLKARLPNLQLEPLRKACQLVQQSELDSNADDRVWHYAKGCYDIGREMVDILVDLEAGTNTLVAAMLYRAVREGQLTIQQVEKQFGKACATMIEGVLRMAAMGSLLDPTQRNVLGQQSGQLDNVRKMLVAMIDDVSVALIKLAERTVILHAVKKEDDIRRLKVAREIFDIYAPLAHRLGIGQLKWELEDLSFRYLQPEAYHQIAKLLDEKRLDRERYIEQVVAVLKSELDKADIKAEVKGRVKHIYSIWRKMQKKQLAFHQVYDIRAVRVLVDEVRDCYTVLGIVHTLWQHLPKEFDDYIANPKSNGYQSLHTAVVGPDKKMLEVQIRTHQMHDDAELGVCAHWRYKEGASTKAEAYERKIAWLRQVLSWHEELGENAADMAGEIYQSNGNRIYVFTPDGHVLDLEEGSTPIDFAYHIHTEVGHRCRGAKVNGRVVPLNYKLQTGEQVEILTVREGGPSRDWLMPSLGYIHTSMARGRIQQWFRHLSRETHLAEGKQLLERELKRVALNMPTDWNDIAAKVNLKARDDVFVALGAGNLRVNRVVSLVQARQAPPDEPIQQELILQDDNKRDIKAEGVRVAGVDHLLTQLANCCQPLPGDPIMGFITQGRGVTVHHASCTNLLALQAKEPARIVEVSWGESNSITYPADLFIRVKNRPGVLKDLLSLMATERVNVSALHTDTRPADETAILLLTVEIDSLEKLGDLLRRMDQFPDVLEARRYKK